MVNPPFEHIDTEHAFLDAEDAADARRAEYEQLRALTELADLAYWVIHGGPEARRPLESAEMVG